ncbi:MAG TPA: hypothetical protein PLU72_18180 [Candidatus Ozemobacteraceae bacterium]|nr:hypothetical protein [Candidatus Ozemobacteraceae bacterium]HQG27591.1 hypothetical protein [Candidatus Ozemobacteraceae bacterium]
MKQNQGRHCVLVLFLLFGILAAAIPAQASPLDKVIEFYISSVPNPPNIGLDAKAVWDMAETGDIIIENNRAFPQWYAMIGSLIPDCRFVHAGMIIKGHMLKSLAEEISPQSAVTLHAYYRGAPPRIVDGKVKKVYDWFPYPIDPKGIYVVTPEVTVNTSISRIVALNLKDYLVDPAIGYPTKHIRLIRPRLATQGLVRILAKYLTYHAIKKTTYDMGFVSTETETAISRLQNGELMFDMTAAPVPLYCTELVYRALREAGIEIPTTKMKKAISGALSKIPRMPRSVLQKIDSPFITADVLMCGGAVVYQNDPPPTVREAIAGMVDLNFKAVSQGLLERFQSIAASISMR